MRMSHIILSSVACQAVALFPNKNCTVFGGGGELLNLKYTTPVGLYNGHNRRRTAHTHAGNKNPREQKEKHFHESTNYPLPLIHINRGTRHIDLPTIASFHFVTHLFSLP